MITAIDLQAQAVRRNFCRTQRMVAREGRRHFARHPRPLADQRLFWTRRREYLKRVLAHTNPSWWLSRATLNPATDDWLAERCECCAGVVVGWFADTQLKWFGHVHCAPCRERMTGTHPSQSELDRKAVAR